jgi:predicted O-methyltransferase YrrM
MEELKQRIITTQWLQYEQKRRMDDLLAMSYIQPLLKDIFLPFSNASIRPFSMACILNDLLINKRKSILEFGAGLSTILMGRLIAQHRLDSIIISVEQDKGWIEFIQELIDKEKLEKIVRLLYAPLVDSAKSLDNNKWYDENSLRLIENVKLDMVIIDGPTAWEPQKHKARYPAFPFIINKLANDAVVYLDDAERKGEQFIIKKWEKEFNVKFNVTGDCLAYFNKGNGFIPLIDK